MPLVANEPHRGLGVFPAHRAFGAGVEAEPPERGEIVRGAVLLPLEAYALDDRAVSQGHGERVAPGPERLRHDDVPAQAPEGAEDGLAASVRQPSLAGPTRAIDREGVEPRLGEVHDQHRPEAAAIGLQGELLEAPAGRRGRARRIVLEVAAGPLERDVCRREIALEVHGLQDGHRDILDRGGGRGLPAPDRLDRVEARRRHLDVLERRPLRQQEGRRVGAGLQVGRSSPHPAGRRREGERERLRARGLAHADDLCRRTPVWRSGQPDAHLIVAGPDHGVRRDATPAAVQACGHRPVHRVVDGRDAIEHAPDRVRRQLSGLVADGHSPHRFTSWTSSPS